MPKEVAFAALDSFQPLQLHTQYCHDGRRWCSPVQMQMQKEQKLPWCFAPAEEKNL
jgi:hypothetical protein